MTFLGSRLWTDIFGERNGRLGFEAFKDFSGDFSHIEQNKTFDTILIKQSPYF